MPTLILVRHGRSTANTEGLLAGWTLGVALDERAGPRRPPRCPVGSPPCRSRRSSPARCNAARRRSAHCSTPGPG
ncbi:hypothetical protein LV779_09470 [Streptomyces thinghirensis]|nr:hypothetical protein [Streptomyces thinghirensis]